MLIKAIFDANAIINSLDSSLGALLGVEKPLGWYTEYLDCFTTPRVLEEVENTLERPEYREMREDYGRVKGDLSVEEADRGCKGKIRSEIVKTQFPAGLDPGELSAAALALKKSRECREGNLLLIMFDRSAHQILDEIFRRQAIGMVVSPLDACLLLYSKHFNKMKEKYSCTPRDYRLFLKQYIHILGGEEEDRKELAPLFPRQWYISLFEQLYPVLEHESLGTDLPI